MSDREELAFEADYETAIAAVEAAEAAIPRHAHTGDGCEFCAFHTGRQAADAGTAAVTRDPAWWAETEMWIATVPVGDTFTADDLTSVVGMPEGSPNQVGARLRSWAQGGSVKPVGFAQAARAQSHGRFLRVWQVI